MEITQEDKNIIAFFTSLGVMIFGGAFIVFNYTKSVSSLIILLLISIGVLLGTLIASATSDDC